MARAPTFRLHCLCGLSPRIHNLRILLVSSTAQVSKSFLSEVVGNIDRNVQYQIFSKLIDPFQIGVIPRMKKLAKMREHWSGDSIIIDRDQLNLKDPTINAIAYSVQFFQSVQTLLFVMISSIRKIVPLNCRGRRQSIGSTRLSCRCSCLGDIHLSGNTWHQDDLVARLMKDPQFDFKRKMPAIISESKHPELWERWAPILCLMNRLR